MTRGASVAAMMAAWLATGSSADAQSITGRWAHDASACSGAGTPPHQSPLVITASAVRWLNDSCRIARMYKTGDTVHLQAVCQHSGGERSVPVRLRPYRDRLLVHWDRSHSVELRRCRQDP